VLSLGSAKKVYGTRKVYILAAVLSVVLYVAGIATGYNLQQEISSTFGGEIASIRSDIYLVEQELPLLSLRGEGSCTILYTLSSDVSSRLNLILDRIVELERRGVTGSEYDGLLKDYTSLTVRGWILDKDIKQSCLDTSVPILYFYSVPCDDCIEQGMILDRLREKYGRKLPVFSLNSGIDQPAIKILTKSFNITRTPAMIIDSLVIQGSVTEEALDKMICSRLKSC
jgi:hypothetical protein